MIIQAILLTFYLCYHALACDDISASACQKFAAQNPAMCDYGTCYSTLCPRTCHKCALKCYSCGNVDRPENCQTTIECPSKDHRCILARSFTDDFREVYGLGCAFGSVCDSVEGEKSCCSTDLCNNNKTQPTTTTRRENKDVQQRDTTCADIHEDACRDLAATDASICGTQCAKTLCPVTCGVCTQCYNCDYVSDSTQCTSKTFCHPGEYCYAIETINSYSEHGFRLGCAPDLLCSKLSSVAVNTFGRKRTVAGACCDGNLCNDHLKAVTTTTTTTTTTTQPTTTTTTKDPTCQCSGDTHYSTHNDCFFISATQGTRQTGKDYCRTHCGKLASFTDDNQLSHVMRYYYDYFRHNHFNHDPLGLDHHAGGFLGYHRHDHMFVDAIKSVKSHLHPSYIWESTQRPVSSSLINYHNANRTYTDMCAVTSSLHSDSIQAADCTESHYAICQLIQ